MSRNATSGAERDRDRNAIYAIGHDKGTRLYQPTAPEHFPNTIGVKVGAIPLHRGDVIIDENAPILTMDKVRADLAKTNIIPNPDLADTDQDGFIFPEYERITHSVPVSDATRTDRGTVLELPN
jgi:hypothetical protein